MVVAANASTYRSGPSSRGASMASGRCVFTPGSTKNAVRPKYFSDIASRVCWTGGTTFEIATPWTSEVWMPRVRSSVSMKRPYSSEVCSRRLVRRQETSSRRASKMPIFVLVLPTSATSSMVRPPLARRPGPRLGDLAGHDSRQPPVLLHQERAVGRQVHGHAAHAVHRDAPSDGVGEGEPPLAHRGDPLVLEATPPRVELLQHRREHGVALRRPARLPRHGGRVVPELGREFPLRQVDPDADDDGRGDPRLHEDPGDLSPAHEDVVRPLEPRLEPGGPPERLGHR